MSIKEAMQVISLDVRGDLKKEKHKPIEGLEEIWIRSDDHKKKVRIGSNVGKDLRKNLIECLLAHTDVFTWSYDAM